ncbi:MAG: histidine phosphatase family protein [Planctomycetota bacterium]
MKTLILMRHAKSDWKDPELSDHDRPLNARGRRSAPLIGEQLASHDRIPEFILASSAARVQETVALLRDTFRDAAGDPPEVQTESSLYLASASEILSHISVLHDAWNQVLVCGHNPGMNGLACHFAQDSFDFPTAATLVLRTPSISWKDALREDEWTLEHFWKPRELEA